MAERVTGADIAAACGVSEKTIRNRWMASADWPVGEKTGQSHQLTWSLDALPKQLKRQRGNDIPVRGLVTAWLQKQGRVEATISAPESPVEQPENDPFSYDRGALWAAHDRKPEKQKAVGRQRLAMLDAAVTLRNTGLSMTDAMRAIAQREDVSAKTIANWYYGVNGQAGVRQYDRRDWLPVLTPSYAGRTAEAEIPQPAWDMYVADYLRLEQPAAKACFNRVKLAAKANGWGELPAPVTFQRRIKKAFSPIAVVRARQGVLAANRLYPPQQRTVADMHALEGINGDGYQHNVFVRWPDGSIARPKTWVWQDIYSRMFLAWRTDLTEHTDVIRLSFGDVAEKYGLPDFINLDNTRAAANKWMTGGVPWRNRFKTQPEDVLGLFPQLGIEVVWTKLDKTAGGKNTGHGQAKPIERHFGWGGVGEYVDKHPAFAGAWCGNNPTAKPENYGSKAIPLDEFLAVLDSAMHELNELEERKSEMAGGVLSHRQVFEQSLEESLIVKPTVEQRRLWMLPSEARTVQKDGITLDAGSAPGAPRNRYWSEEMASHIGAKVVARFNPDDLHAPVHIYSMDGRYICLADCYAPVGYRDTQSGREHNRARRQVIKSIEKRLEAEVKLDALQAAKLLPPTEHPKAPETKLARVFRPAAKAAGSDVLISQEEQEQMADNFRRNVIRLAGKGD